MFILKVITISTSVSGRRLKTIEVYLQVIFFNDSIIKFSFKYLNSIN